MSDNIPFDIQRDIIKRVSNVSNVKSVIRFRSVSKQWKSFIDSSEFINGYGARHTEPHRHILSYVSKTGYNKDDPQYICLGEDDDIETVKLQKQVSPLMNQCNIDRVVGASHGLLCLLGYYELKDMLIIWNPTIGKSFGITLNTWFRTTHEFKVVNLPDALKKCSVNYEGSISLSELRGSLVVCEYKSLAEAEEADVWVMGNDSSFRKQFTIRAPRINQILGFKKNGETVFISRSYAWGRPSSVLHVYDPCSQQIKNLGISGEYDSFYMGAYKESLLLLDHLDSHIYQDNSDQDDDDNI